MTETSINHLEVLAKVCESKSFLNKEFLIWIWFTIEETGGSIKLTIDDAQQLTELWIENKITLEKSGDNVMKHSLNGGDPSSSIEATAALLNGKAVTEIRLGISLEDSEYSFTINHKDLCPKSVNMPKETSQADNPEQRLHKRASAIMTLAKVIDCLFNQFLSKRIETSWEDDVISIREWILLRKQMTD